MKHSDEKEDRLMVETMMRRPHKAVAKHLKKDIKESKKSIREDKKLMKVVKKKG